MSCTYEYQQEVGVLTGLTFVAEGQMDAAERCRNPRCELPLNRQGKCPRGHAQEGWEEDWEAVGEMDALLDRSRRGYYRDNDPSAWSLAVETLRLAQMLEVPCLTRRVQDWVTELGTKLNPQEREDSVTRGPGVSTALLERKIHWLAEDGRTLAGMPPVLAVPPPSREAALAAAAQMVLDDVNSEPETPTPFVTWTAINDLKRALAEPPAESRAAPAVDAAAAFRAAAGMVLDDVDDYVHRNEPAPFVTWAAINALRRAAQAEPDVLAEEWAQPEALGQYVAEHKVRGSMPPEYYAGQAAKLLAEHGRLPAAVQEPPELVRLKAHTAVAQILTGGKRVYPQQQQQAGAAVRAVLQVLQQEHPEVRALGERIAAAARQAQESGAVVPPSRAARASRARELCQAAQTLLRTTPELDAITVELLADKLTRAIEWGEGVDATLDDVSHFLEDVPTDEAAALVDQMFAFWTEMGVSEDSRG